MNGVGSGPGLGAGGRQLVEALETNVGNETNTKVKSEETTEEIDWRERVRREVREKLERESGEKADLFLDKIRRMPTANAEG